MTYVVAAVKKAKPSTSLLVALVVGRAISKAGRNRRNRNHRRDGIGNETKNGTGNGNETGNGIKRVSLVAPRRGPTKDIPKEWSVYRKDRKRTLYKNPHGDVFYFNRRNKVVLVKPTKRLVGDKRPKRKLSLGKYKSRKSYNGVNGWTGGSYQDYTPYVGSTGPTPVDQNDTTRELDELKRQSTDQEAQMKTANELKERAEALILMKTANELKERAEALKNQKAAAGDELKRQVTVQRILTKFADNRDEMARAALAKSAGNLVAHQKQAITQIKTLKETMTKTQTELDKANISSAFRDGLMLTKDQRTNLFRIRHSLVEIWYKYLTEGKWNAKNFRNELLQLQELPTIRALPKLEKSWNVFLGPLEVEKADWNMNRARCLVPVLMMEVNSMLDVLKKDQWPDVSKGDELNFAWTVLWSVLRVITHLVGDPAPFANDAEIDQDFWARYFPKIFGLPDKHITKIFKDILDIDLKPQDDNETWKSNVPVVINVTDVSKLGRIIVRENVAFALSWIFGEKKTVTPDGQPEINQYKVGTAGENGDISYHLSCGAIQTTYDSTSTDLTDEFDGYQQIVARYTPFKK